MSAREFRLKTGWPVGEVAKLFGIDEKTMLANEAYIYMPDLTILSEILNMPELEYEV